MTEGVEPLITGVDALERNGAMAHPAACAGGRTPTDAYVEDGGHVRFTLVVALASAKAFRGQEARLGTLAASPVAVARA